MEAMEKRVKGISDRICPEKKAKRALNARALRKRKAGTTV
jgi:hypothetical protein